MSEIRTNSDKRNSLVSVAYSEPSGLQFIDYPGNKAYLSGTFIPISYSEANFTESDSENGAPVDQELNIIIRGQNESTDDLIVEITGKYLILKLGFMNGDVKIIGVPDNPVVLISSSAGNPVVNTVSTKRNSAEKTKYLVSL